MNKSILSILCLPFFATTFTHVVEEDVQRNLSFQSAMELDLAEFSVLMEIDGEEREMPTPDDSLHVSSGESIHFSDTLTQVEDGHPAHIERVFNDLTIQEIQKAAPEGKEEQSNERNATSPMDGVTLNMVLDEDGEWSMSVADDEDFDEEVLEKLGTHFGFLNFLPEELEAEVGDEWELPLEAYTQFQRPSGDLSFEFEVESPFPGYENQFAENMEGEFLAQYSSLDEEEAQAHIALHLQLETFMHDGYEPEAEGAEVELARHVEVQLDLEGELIWDLENGCLVSISLAGDVINRMIISQVVRPDDGPFEERTVTRNILMEGTLSQILEMD